MNSTMARSTAISWTVLFAAVIAHLPGVAFDFVQDDFAHLARGAGLLAVDGWTIRPFSTWWIWTLQWSAFGSDPSFLHGLSVVLAGLVALMTVRVGLRMGLGREGAAVAGLWMCLTTTTNLPTAWASAAAELWAVLFALIALELWTDPRGGARAPLAAAAAVLSLLCKESAIALFVLLPIAQAWFGPSQIGGADRRGRRLLLAVLALVATASAVGVARHFDVFAADAAYAPAAPTRMPENLFLLFGWATVPAGLFPGPLVLKILGAGLLAGALVRGWIDRRRGDRGVLFGLLVALAGIAPATLLAAHHYAYYSLIGAVGWAWILGRVLGPGFTRLVSGGPTWTGGLLLAALLLIGGVGGAALRHEALWTRDASGQLVEPILERSLQVPELRRTLAAFVERSRPQAWVVLQATRVEIPESMAERGEEVIVRSPAYVTLAGPVGLRMLTAPEIAARWTTSLDGIPLDSVVLLDAGDAALRPLGPPENARMYSALIAVAAGQYDRARHDLWWVINLQGTTVQFAFDPDFLPIAPEELDATAPEFLYHLALDPSPSAGRVARLFEQMYEAVRGRELPRRDLGSTLRAPRLD